MALGQDAWWRVVTGNQGKAGEAKAAGVQEGLCPTAFSTVEVLFPFRNTLCGVLFINTSVG